MTVADNTYPLRLHLLRRLTEELEKITTANGYAHDLGDAVFRGRAVFGHDDPLPMVSILEAPDERVWLEAQPDGSAHGKAWVLLVQGWAEDDSRHPTDPAYVLLADVQRRLAELKAEGAANFLGPWQGREIGRGGSPVTEVQIGAGICRPPDELSDKSHFWLTLTLMVVDDLQAPYSY